MILPMRNESHRGIRWIWMFKYEEQHFAKLDANKEAKNEAK